MDTVAAKRKLIDLKGPVFETLSLQARRQGVSLKKYIEGVLEDDARAHQAEWAGRVTDTRILGLVGIAKHAVAQADPDDERLQYILSK
jgi:hypothetical protein